MGPPLLETKLRAPRRRRGAVARRRLIRRLDGADPPALTLVSAPAGFGKTTLLTDWLAAGPPGPRVTAWLSLDRRDDDPAAFWSYVVAALRAVAPDLIPGASAVVGSPGWSADALVATLLNDLDAGGRDVVLVLDDYHLIASREVHEAMAFLLERLPHAVRLVVATRADPPFPLAALRARGELLEIRAADLRFTADEAAEYLNGSMGLALTAAEVEALEARTEGWIAALQLAALSMQGREDAAAFVSGFAGDDRHVVDYLVDEVLARQPPDLRDFLLATSILSRLTGPLCEAVTGAPGGGATLEALDRGNLFVVPLDDRRAWYRYHHLFAEMLRARLLDERPERVAGIHRRASEWYELHGDAAEAIRHALAGGDAERAGALIEPAIPELGRTRQEATMRAWLEALPQDVPRTRPVLGIGLVGALMATGDFARVETLLDDVERCLEAPPADMVVVDEDQFARLPAQAAMYRTALALIAGDVPGTIAHADRALELAGADDHLVRGGAAALRGLAHWRGGDLDAAVARYSEAIDSLTVAGRVADVLGCSLALADMRVAQGRLGEAMATLRSGLDRAAGHGPVRGTADMHVAMGELLRERGDLEGALGRLRVAEELGAHAGLPQNAYRGRVALARVLQARGDLHGALALLEEAERVQDTDFSPDVRPIPALRARLWIAAGDPGAALAWARERDLSADDEPAYLREFEHLTLARALLAASAPGASGLLDRLLTAAEAGGRGGSAIEVLALQALDLRARGDLPAAVARLEEALVRAEPEGYARTFLDEGARMIELLRAAARRERAGARARRLLAVEGEPETRRPPVDLSARELEVLRLLRSELSGPEIARELVVSLNTVRTHTKRIYAKLGVTSRRAAVRRAAELGL